MKTQSTLKKASRTHLMKPKLSTALSLLLGFTLISIAAPRKSAAGPWTFTSIHSYEFSDRFGAYINDSVDLDQRRARGTYMDNLIAGLDYDGKSHCAPTVAANVLGWISRTGYSDRRESIFPDLAPRARDWSPPASSASTAVKRAYNSVYNEQTEFIRELGIEMRTHRTFGTTSDDFTKVLRDRLPDGFWVTTTKDGGCPTGPGLPDPDIGLTRIYNEISSGNLVVLHYNTYQELPSALGARKFSSPIDAHTVFVTGVELPKDPSGSGSLFVADPLDESPVAGNELMTQSEFEERGIIDIPSFETAVSYKGDRGACSTFRKKATVIPTDSSRLVKIITGITVISPPVGGDFIGFLPTEVISE